MEAPGGVRPEATPALVRQVVGALTVEAKECGGVAGVAARERFEGEHPLVSWFPGRDGKTRDAGYAPPECRLKRWPIKALSGAWHPRLSGECNRRFEIGGAYAQTSDHINFAGKSPAASFAGRGVSATSPLVGASIRPLREIARAVGWSILLTTHFSGADEALPGRSFAAYLSVVRALDSDLEDLR